MDKSDFKKLGEEIFLTNSDEQLAVLMHDFKYVKTQVALLGNLKDIDYEEPLIFPFLAPGFLAKDEPEPTMKPQQLFKNAKTVEDDFIVLPKVVK